MITNTGTKINEETIKVIESFIQAKLPDEYRDFLLKYNGGIPDKIIFNISALAFFHKVNSSDYYSDFVVAYHTYIVRIPKGFIVVASDVGGNNILLGLEGKDRGKIYFWDHEEEVDEDEEADFRNMTLISNSFNQFVDSLKEEID